MDTYRHLTDVEISALTSAGCTAADWSLVEVQEPFELNHYKNVTFSGFVKLGTTSKVHVRHVSAIPYQSGIYNATLHNCVIGNDVYLSDIHNFIADVDVADNCFIQNVDRISSHAGAKFGVGVEVSVLNETGGREVPISPSLSAHVAYLMAMYRHDEKLSSALRSIVGHEADTLSSERGRIGESSLIRNVGSITDVNIGPAAIVEGTSRLSNGTIASCSADPVVVGTDVVAEDFIFASGSRVEDGAMVMHSFVGQGTHISRLFSAHDSLFFANCTCENGEAAAIFAGPYTVTMHKSSLLIAGMFSFLNAGSGSNQSNHMYKLGPIHQGVVERGSKTTSDSYILWPARIGAFSLVMGRHVSHPDTSTLPFSYLIENHQGANLVPGANLRSVGTIRDAQKWPKRDRRRDPDKLDHINFNLLSPYTVNKMMRGIELLTSIEATSGMTSETYSYQGMTIKASSLRKGREYYQMAVDKFFGNSVLTRLKDCPNGDDRELQRFLAPTHSAGAGEWIDLAGLIAPKSEIEKLTSEISAGKFSNLAEINETFAKLAADYYDMEWTWVSAEFEHWHGKPLSEIGRDDVVAIAKRWLKAVLSIDNMLLEDACKEFSRVSQTGFGVDSKCLREADFMAVRGDFSTDPFVVMVKEHITAKTMLHDDLMNRLFS